MWPSLDLKTIMLVLDGIKKQLELHLIVKSATEIYNERLSVHSQEPNINECCMKAKEILNTSKTMVGV